MKLELDAPNMSSSEECYDLGRIHYKSSSHLIHNLVGAVNVVEVGAVYARFELHLNGMCGLQS